MSALIIAAVGVIWVTSAVAVLALHLGVNSGPNTAPVYVIARDMAAAPVILARIIIAALRERGSR